MNKLFGQAVRMSGGKCVQLDAAKERVQTLYTTFGLVSDDGYSLNGYMGLLDAQPTDNPRIYQVEHVGHFGAGRSYIASGWAAIVDRIDVHRTLGEQSKLYIYHTDTRDAAEKALRESIQQVKKVEQRKRLFARATYVSRQMLHGLGFCDVGIDNWVKQFIPARMVKNDRIGLADLATILAVPETAGSWHTQTLIKALAANPGFKPKVPKLKRRS